MTKKKTILIVDDHPIVATSLNNIIHEIDDAEVIGIAFDGKSCIEFVNARQPDIIMLDYQLPDLSGMKVTEQIKLKYPHIHIIIFTGRELSDFAVRLLELQVSGFLSKDADEKTIKMMITSVMHNHTIMPISLLRQLKMIGPASSCEKLTDYEVKIMKMVIDGKTNEEIAEQLYVSKRTVDNYLKKIYLKLGVTSRTLAVQKFLRQY